MSFDGAPSIVVTETREVAPKVRLYSSSMFMCLGTARRGPIGQAIVSTSFKDVVAVYGGFADNDEATLIRDAWAFFGMGGTLFCSSRVVHMSDLTDPESYTTAARGSVTLQNEAPADTLSVEAKYTGDTPTVIRIADASSRIAEEFDLTVIENGSKTGTFRNLTMDSTSDRYVETEINKSTVHTIVATDELLAGTVAEKRPANGDFTLAGGNDGLTGLDDTDFTGNEAGPTGVYNFDTVSGGRILAAPGKCTPAVQKGLINYAETHREGSMFVVSAVPSGKTCAEAADYVITTASLLDYSEFGAIYYPWLKVFNPDSNVFGDVETIPVPPEAWVAGRYAANDSMYADGSGVYKSPAGTTHGALKFAADVEDAPSGREGESHEVNQYRRRSLCTRARINIIHADHGPLRIDDALSLKSSSGGALFPEVRQRRSAIQIVEALRNNAEWIKHLDGTDADIKEVQRWGEDFLSGEMEKGAFVSKDPETAFKFIANQTPTYLREQGIIQCKVGLAVPNSIRHVWFDVTNTAAV